MTSKREHARRAFLALTAKLPASLPTGALAAGTPSVSNEATEAARGLVGGLPGDEAHRSERIARLAAKLDRLREVATAIEPKSAAG